MFNYFAPWILKDPFIPLFSQNSGLKSYQLTVFVHFFTIKYFIWKIFYCDRTKFSIKVSLV